MTDFKTGHIPDPRDTSFTEDVGKVKVNEGFHIVHSIWCERANERIAELEAENEALVETQRRKVVLLLGDRERAERALKQAETELAALKEQYCDDCKNESYCAVLAAAYEEFNDLGDGGRDFACNRWTARAEEGSE